MPELERCSGYRQNEVSSATRPGCSQNPEGQDGMCAYQPRLPPHHLVQPDFRRDLVHRLHMHNILRLRHNQVVDAVQRRVAKGLTAVRIRGKLGRRFRDDVLREF